MVSGGAAAAVRRGHPWVFREQVTAGLAEQSLGAIVTIVDAEGNPCARAVADPASAIAARVWTLDPRRDVDAALMRERFEHALRLRDTLMPGGVGEGGDGGETTAMRWVHGEGDRMPGVVVDRYAHVAILRLDGEAMATFGERLADVLFPVVAARGIRSIALRSTHRGDTGPRAPREATRLRTLRGEDPPEVIAVTEHGMPFLVDLAHGQKTGAFLDQRDNRRRVRQLARGRRVLNLFSYAGGFSIAAALGGATACTSVDVAAAAHATAQASVRHAGVDLDAHEFVTADVWRFLEQAARRGQRWDLVVSDPPNMAPSEASHPRALAAYRKLHAACVAVLAPGGIFCAASCSSHVSVADFVATLDDEALGRSDLRIVEIAGAGPDHPVLAGFPEGRYLKFCVLG